jgi:methylmalonyl-CoA mutase, C-terminal domain
MPRVLLAKTGLDGHWRGPLLVAQTLRDAGFEVVLLGMARDDEIVQATVQEDVDLVGLSVGGRVEVAERVVDALADGAPGVPVFAGGVLPPWAAERLRARGIEVFPPGSSLASIVDAARRLTGDDAHTEEGG